MKHTRFLRCCLLVVLLFNATLIYGQEVKSEDTARFVNRAPDGLVTQLPKLSPGAQEVAREIGVIKLIEQLYLLPERERGAGGAMSLTALSLRQEISEVVLGTSLEVDGLIAEIDNEL